jgi:hypothetical protein
MLESECTMILVRESKSHHHDGGRKVGASINANVTQEAAARETEGARERRRTDTTVDLETAPDQMVHVLIADDSYRIPKRVDPRLTLLSLVTSERANKAIVRLHKRPATIAVEFTLWLIAALLGFGTMVSSAVPRYAAWFTVVGLPFPLVGIAFMQAKVARRLFADFQVKFQMASLAAWCGMELYMFQDERCMFVVAFTWSILYSLLGDASHAGKKSKLFKTMGFIFGFSFALLWSLITLLGFVTHQNTAMLVCTKMNSGSCLRTRKYFLARGCWY